MIANLLLIGAMFAVVSVTAIILAYNIAEAYKLEDY